MKEKIAQPSHAASAERTAQARASGARDAVRPLIIVSSRTGNTMAVAHAVHDALAPAGAVLLRADALPADLSGFNPVILGFWCDRGMAPEDMQRAAERLEGKRLGCFATLGGDPDTPRAQDWMRRTSAALAEAGRGNTLGALFLCRGRIDPALFEAMARMPMPHSDAGKRSEGEEAPGASDEAAAAQRRREADERSEARRQRWQAAETHPDRLDCLKAADVFRAFAEAV